MMTEDSTEENDMSITDHFGGKKIGNRKIEPGVQLPAPRPPRPLHPVALERAAKLDADLLNYSEAMENLDRLQEANQALTASCESLKRINADFEKDNVQLRADLEIERRHLGEVQKILIEEREQLEIFRSYAVKIRTHLEHLSVAAVKAHDIAMEIDPKPIPSTGDEAVKKVLEEMDKALTSQVVETKTPVA